ncbi:MAG: putative Protein dedA [Parcubacteria group bacterium Licking1014_17]|nr:MAG: putative Protein dedA [Parcubacteria group bacterium Licking1014_17]
MGGILGSLASWALGVISHFGYAGIFVTQFLESALIPIPSEIVLPFSGFLAATGRFNFWLVMLAATLANTLGSSLIFLLGWYGGRPLVEKHGHFLFIHTDDILKVDKWAAKHGLWVAFVSRLLPGIRTVSGIALGSMRIPFWRFLLPTILGSFLWNLWLAYVGFKAGNNWEFLAPYFKKFEYVIIALIVIGLVWYVWRHIKKGKK